MQATVPSSHFQPRLEGEEIAIQTNLLISRFAVPHSAPSIVASYEDVLEAQPQNAFVNVLAVKSDTDLRTLSCFTFRVLPDNADAKSWPRLVPIIAEETNAEFLPEEELEGLYSIQIPNSETCLKWESDDGQQLNAWCTKHGAFQNPASNTLNQ